MEAIKAMWHGFIGKRKAQQLARAVMLVEAHGLTVCEIRTIAGTDYIISADGSMHKIGGKK